MNRTSKNAIYSAFGLIISSDFHLPELIHIDYENDDADLIIKHEDLSNLWLKNVKTDSYYFIKENLCLVRVPDVAIFKIEYGRAISYSPIGKSNDDQIRLYLLGTCLGVALMQKKVLPIHGSCIAIDGKAYAFVGDSGAGKSTLASAFINRGFQFLTDDVIAVTLFNDNIPFVIPSYPQQKLWQESLTEFGVESEHFKPIYSRETKFAIPINDHFHDQPMPLAGVFVLSKANQDDIEIYPIGKLERLPILYHNTYRNFMISRLGLMEWHFYFSANMVNKLDFHQIIRPNSHFTANELVDEILDIINNSDKLGGKKINTIHHKGEKVI
ncbi:aldolase [Virgibacillus profundi]|uniref:Aldolase n=1 Tax=Virgibacillus profundi TaxID=2024555 RepID=A0A2A2IJF7_9BACI|nr:aldolase [Virgibacillus profundi]PAV31528.1 aldolase [Virgibacillus profundi]PXY55714.1 aldolase [Virgibacillus profundi]